MYHCHCLTAAARSVFHFLINLWIYFVYAFDIICEHGSVFISVRSGSNLCYGPEPLITMLDRSIILSYNLSHLVRIRLYRHYHRSQIVPRRPRSRPPPAPPTWSALWRTSKGRCRCVWNAWKCGSKWRRALTSSTNARWTVPRIGSWYVTQP
jgi:hypothetical protein